MEIADDNITTGTMDHHGLVAAGKAVVAMILNGLGFTNRRLYLTHQFFATKPVEILLAENIAVSDITDDTLGHALDEIATYGASKRFGEIAFEIALENNLLGSVNHLDPTSICSTRTI